MAGAAAQNPEEEGQSLSGNSIFNDRDKWWRLCEWLHTHQDLWHFDEKFPYGISFIVTETMFAGLSFIVEKGSVRRAPARWKRNFAHYKDPVLRQLALLKGFLRVLSVRRYLMKHPRKDPSTLQDINAYIRSIEKKEEELNMNATIIVLFFSITNEDIYHPGNDTKQKSNFVYQVSKAAKSLPYFRHIAECFLLGVPVSDMDYVPLTDEEKSRVTIAIQDADLRNNGAMILPHDLFIKRFRGLGDDYPAIIDQIDDKEYYNNSRMYEKRFAQTYYAACIVQKEWLRLLLDEKTELKKVVPVVQAHIKTSVFKGVGEVLNTITSFDADMLRSLKAASDALDLVKKVGIRGAKPPPRNVCASGHYSEEEIDPAETIEANEMEADIKDRAEVMKELGIYNEPQNEIAQYKAATSDGSAPQTPQTPDHLKKKQVGSTSSLEQESAKALVLLPEKVQKPAEDDPSSNASESEQVIVRRKSSKKKKISATKKDSSGSESDGERKDATQTGESSSKQLKLRGNTDTESDSEPDSMTELSKTDNSDSESSFVPPASSPTKNMKLTKKKTTPKKRESSYSGSDSEDKIYIPSPKSLKSVNDSGTRRKTLSSEHEATNKHVEVAEAKAGTSNHQSKSRKSDKHTQKSKVDNETSELTEDVQKVKEEGSQGSNSL
ncbi:hypothetical protein TKK_0014718 [Trichogramma kaykai]